MKYKLLLLFLILFSACVSDKNITNTTYFGGKIINPKSKNVLFYSGEQLLDSAKLSHKNKFLFEFDSIKTGLYTFKHGPEVQFIFLKATDSLLLRINTWDFDESLVFSGKGSERNNLLINLFLENEKEDKLIYNFYSLNDSLFDLKIDSLLQRKKLLFKHYKEEVGEVMPLFEKFANAAVYLPLYRKKEAYPYRHKKALNLDEYSHVDPNFYRFRKNIDINDEDLHNFYAQYEYVRTYLYHLSYEDYLLDKESTMSLNFFNAIISKISNDKLKDHLLDEGIWNVVMSDKISDTKKEEAQKIFYEQCNNANLKSTIKDLIKSKEALPINTQFPTLVAQNFSNQEVTINNLINGKNTAIYFWPKGTRQVENLIKKVNYLKKNYPKILFIGIDSKNTDRKWKSCLKSNHLNTNQQFRLVNNDADWIDFDFSRVILINNKGLVKNGFTHFSSHNIEYQLKKLQKE